MLKILGKKTSHKLSCQYCPNLPQASFHARQLAKIPIINNQMQKMWQHGKP
jgi:hypothetical protein